MSESKDHWQILDSSGALDLTFAFGRVAKWVANVKSAPLAASVALLALCGSSSVDAGFRSPESLVRNVYAYYGDRTSALSSGLPHDPETAQQFFDSSLRNAWLARTSAPYDFLVQSANWKLGAVSIAILRKQFDRTYVTAGFNNQGKPVTMNFIVVNSPEGWVIYDVESPHDSLRAYLAQYRN
jgi:hypothetical protein